MKTFKDVLGQDVSVGDYIGYATRSGNSGLLKIGKVLEVPEGDKLNISVVSVYLWVTGAVCKGGKTRLNNPSNIVRIREDAVPESYKKVLGDL